MQPNSLTRPSFRALALGVALLSVVACGRQGGGEGQADAAGKSPKKDQAAQVDAVPVEVAAAARRPIVASYSGTATLDAPAEAQVVAKATGVVLEIRSEEGQFVKAGQVLARLDPDRKGLLLAQSQAQLKKLESEYARSKELFAKQIVSADAHERLRAELEVQRAALDIARLEYSYTNIVAPISGVIAERMVKEGNLVQTNMPLFRIVDTSSLEAVLNVPERELATMKSGLPVAMMVDAVPGTRFEGKIDRVSPVVDSGSGTFRVTAAFAGSNQLKPGMFGRIEIVYDERANALTVPRESLLEGESGAAVYTVREGKAVRTPVRLGYINGAYAEVVSGVEEGDQIVTVGKVTLRDGATVNVVNAPTAEGNERVAKVASEGTASE